jgi:hypothetical protein
MGPCSDAIPLTVPVRLEAILGGTASLQYHSAAGYREKVGPAY